MEFVRKRKRGQNKKVQKSWFSEEGYRITWRKEVCGVRVAARFQACVRVLVSHSNGEPRLMWDFVNRNRRLIKTLKTAIEECERHKRLWERACQATGIRALKELFNGKLPLGLPQWVRKKVDRRLYAILIDNRPTKYRDDEEDERCTKSLLQSSDAPGPGGPIKTLDGSALSTEVPPKIPTLASPAEDKEPSPARKTRRAPSKAANTGEPSAVPPAEAAAKRRKKRAAKRKPITTDSSASDAKPSRGPRKRKSMPSAR
jgi:hypothetical protein